MLAHEWLGGRDFEFAWTSVGVKGKGFFIKLGFRFAHDFGVICFFVGV